MKKSVIILFVLVLIASVSSYGQFRVGLGLMVGLPAGDFGDAVDLGIGGYLEPKYALNEKLDVGLFLGTSIFGGTSVSGSSFSATKITSVLATGDFKVSASKVTPYVGAGLGLYFQDFGSIGVSGQPDIDIGSETKFGFAPRAGVMLGRLNLGLTYNIVSDTNHMAINVGFEIGSKRVE